MDPDSVDVSVDGGILTVKAQRSERTELDVQWISSERFTGGFMRRLSLGADIDADHTDLRNRGVDVDDEVMRMGDPVPPMFFLRDPDGNRYLVAQEG